MEGAESTEFEEAISEEPDLGENFDAILAETQEE